MNLLFFRVFFSYNANEGYSLGSTEDFCSQKGYSTLAVWECLLHGMSNVIHSLSHIPTLVSAKIDLEAPVDAP